LPRAACGFARAIFQQAEQRLHTPAPEVVPIPTTEFPTPARRPAYSVLDCEKLFQTFGVRLAPWQTALEDVLARLAP
jgi:dTDP-4-dehydrorhamnose reductase